MSLRESFAALFQSIILKTTKVPESPSTVWKKVARPQQAWSHEQAGSLHKELCKTRQDIWQQKHPQPECTQDASPHSKSNSGRMHLGKKKNKKQNKKQNNTPKEPQQPHALTLRLPQPHRACQTMAHSQQWLPLCWEEKQRRVMSLQPSLLLPPDPKASLSFPHPKARPLTIPSFHQAFGSDSHLPLIHLFLEEISFHYLPGSSALWGITGGEWKIHVQVSNWHFCFFFCRGRKAKEKDVNGADSRVSGYLLPVIKIKSLTLLLSSVP